MLLIDLFKCIQPKAVMKIYSSECKKFIVLDLIEPSCYIFVYKDHIEFFMSINKNPYRCKFQNDHVLEFLERTQLNTYIEKKRKIPIGYLKFLKVFLERQLRRIKK